MNDEFSLLNVWFFRKHDNFNHIDYYFNLDEEQISNKELYESLYKHTEAFYQKLPEDKSIEDNDVSSDFFMENYLLTI
jgi:hypothetical protein